MWKGVMQGIEQIVCVCVCVCVCVYVLESDQLNRSIKSFYVCEYMWNFNR